MVLGFLFKKKKTKVAKRKVKKTKPLKRKVAPKPKKKIKKTALKKKATRKKTIKKAVLKKEKNIQKIGHITHYFPRVKAAVIKITKGPLKLGDTVFIKGHTTDFKQKVSSIQIEREPIKVAKKGKIIGLEVKRRTREGDIVFKEF